MTERPNVVLGTLLALASLTGGLVATGLLFLGEAGTSEIAATVLGAFTACVFFLLELREIPLSSMLVVVLALGSAAGLVRTLTLYRREKRLLGRLPLEQVAHGPLAEEARRAGVRLFVLPSSRPLAFCAGLLRPRVVVSAGLLAGLDVEEQKAVVWHEAAHARGKEPLKCLLARFAANTFFWIPLLRALLDRYLLAKELVADREAMARTSRPALAGALSRALEPTPAGSVGLSEFADARVDRLFDPHAKLPALFAPWRVLLSALVLGALALALLRPAQLGPGESERIWTMLTTMSLHGLPGMLLGLLTNVAVFAGVVIVARRVAR